MVKNIGMDGFVADDRFEVVFGWWEPKYPDDSDEVDVAGGQMEAVRHAVIGFAVMHRDVDDDATDGEIVAMVFGQSGLPVPLGKSEYEDDLPSATFDVVRRGEPPDESLSTRALARYVSLVRDLEKDRAKGSAGTHEAVP